MKDISAYVVGSPWHAVVAAAIFKKNSAAGVFLVETLSEPSRAGIIRVAEACGIEWIDLGNLSQLGIRNFSMARPIHSARALKQYTEDIKEKSKDLLNKLIFSRIYYFNLYSPITRIFLEASLYKSVKLIRVEDGVCDYFDFPLVYYPRYQRILKYILISLLGVQRYYSRNCGEVWRRTSDYYLFFPGKIETNKSVKSLFAYRNDILNVLDIVSTTPSDLQKSTCNEGLCEIFIVGQSLSEDRILPLSAEVEIYAKIANRYPGRALIKPHPRSSAEKLAMLKSIAGLNIVTTIWPVEIDLRIMRPLRIVGLWSNPIIYGRTLFGLETYSLAPDLIRSKCVRKGNALRIHRLLLEKFPRHYVDFRETFDR